MKASNAISAAEKTQSAGLSSNNGSKSQLSSPADTIILDGSSDLPDPATHAYRKDLADTALAGRVIASHYAEPLLRHLVIEAPFLLQPEDDSEHLGTLDSGDEMRVLDISRGWAWGYAPDGRVGYVRSEAIGI